MALAVKLMGLCLASAVLASLLKRDAPELGLLLAAAATVVCGVLLLSAARETMALGSELAELTGLSPALFLPLAKAVAVALVTRIAAALCIDAGQSALARVMDTAGAFCALGCAVPLLRAALELLRTWL